jgi:hypothetical protein
VVRRVGGRGRRRADQPGRCPRHPSGVPVRAVAPRAERVFEYPYTGTARLCVVAAAAALAATGLAHLLLLSAPRPLTFFGWIVGLVTTAAVALPFLTGGRLAVMVATALIHLAIGLVVGILVSSAAAGATDRPRRLP